MAISNRIQWIKSIVRLGNIATSAISLSCLPRLMLKAVLHFIRKHLNIRVLTVLQVSHHESLQHLVTVVANIQKGSGREFPVFATENAIHVASIAIIPLATRVCPRFLDFY
jgi:hypothetical protein